MSFIQLICAEVLEELKAVDPKKACGPDNISGRILEEVADVITPSICRICNLSLSSGVFPDQWKLANVNPVHKKDDPTLAENFRPISLLCIISKIFERCVANHCRHFLSPQISLQLEKKWMSYTLTWLKPLIRFPMLI